jgi:hypothetical protein
MDWKVERRVTVDASITSVKFDEIKKETCYTFMWLRATPRARGTRLGDASPGGRSQQMHCFG